MLSVGLQVIAPRVKAYLYTWGQARGTHEGERIPAKIEELDIGYIDGMLLLPLVEEHNIDERSPLCGHTHQSLMEVQFHSYQSHCSVGLVTHTVAKHCYTLQCLVSLQIILWPHIAMPCVVHTACMLPLFHTHSMHTAPVPLTMLCHHLLLALVKVSICRQNIAVVTPPMARNCRHWLAAALLCIARHSMSLLAAANTYKWPNARMVCEGETHNSSFHVYMQSWFHICAALLKGVKTAVHFSFAVMDCADDVLCCAVFCCAELCCAVLNCAVLCCAVLCCAVLCFAVSSSPQPLHPSPKIWAGLLHSLDLIEAWLTSVQHPFWHVLFYGSVVWCGALTGECRDHHHLRRDYRIGQ